MVSTTERTSLGLQRQAYLYMKQFKSNKTLWPKCHQRSKVKSDARGSFQNRQKSGRVGREGKKDWIKLRAKWKDKTQKKNEKREVGKKREGRGKGGEKEKI